MPTSKSLKNEIISITLVMHITLEGRRSTGELLCKAKLIGSSCHPMPASDRISVWFSYLSAARFLILKKKKSLFIWLCWVSVVALEIYFPDQGLNPGCLHWEHGVLDAGPPGESQDFSSCFRKIYFAVISSLSSCLSFSSWGVGEEGREERQKERRKRKKKKEASLFSISIMGPL